MAFLSFVDGNGVRSTTVTALNVALTTPAPDVTVATSELLRAFQAAPCWNDGRVCQVTSWKRRGYFSASTTRLYLRGLAWSSPCANQNAEKGTERKRTMEEYTEPDVTQTGHGSPPLASAGTTSLETTATTHISPSLLGAKASAAGHLLGVLHRPFKCVLVRDRCIWCPTAATDLSQQVGYRNVGSVRDTPGPSSEMGGLVCHIRACATDVR